MWKSIISILTFILLTPCFNLAAQEKSDISSSLMGLYSPFDDSEKITTETTSIGKNHVGYAYAELTGLAAGSFYESTAYLGAAYCIYSKHGYLALEPLAMWKQQYGFGGQFSAVGGWNGSISLLSTIQTSGKPIK